MGRIFQKIMSKLWIVLGFLVILWGTFLMGVPFYSGPVAIKSTGGKILLILLIVAFIGAYVYGSTALIIKGGEDEDAKPRKKKAP